MVKYLSFHNSSSFALTYLWMWMARPQCDTPLVLCIWTPRNAFFQVCLFVRCAEWARKKTKLLCNFGRRWVGNFEVCFVKFSFFFFFFFLIRRAYTFVLWPIHLCGTHDELFQFIFSMLKFAIYPNLGC